MKLKKKKKKVYIIVLVWYYVLSQYGAKKLVETNNIFIYWSKPNIKKEQNKYIQKVSFKFTNKYINWLKNWHYYNNVIIK